MTLPLFGEVAPETTAELPNEGSEAAVAHSLPRPRQHHPSSGDVGDVIETRRGFQPTSINSLDSSLRGGMPFGGVTLVASRARGGSMSLLLGMVLKALSRGQTVLFCSGQLDYEAARGRMTVLKSQVNGYRFAAGLQDAADQEKLRRAHNSIPWEQFIFWRAENRGVSLPSVSGAEDLIVVDVQGGGFTTMRSRVRWLREAVARGGAAGVLRQVMAAGERPPRVFDLPGLGTFADLFDAAMIMHGAAEREPSRRASNEVVIDIIRALRRPVHNRTVALTIDRRYAGLIERGGGSGEGHD